MPPAESIDSRFKFQMLFTQLRDLADFLNIDVLLKGSSDLSLDDNVLIMNSVHTFICGTKRLDY